MAPAPVSTRPGLSRKNSRVSRAGSKWNELTFTAKGSLAGTQSKLPEFVYIAGVPHGTHKNPNEILRRDAVEGLCNRNSPLNEIARWAENQNLEEELK